MISSSVQDGAPESMHSVQDPRGYVRLVAELREQIADGSLKPGDRVSIEAICQRSGWSRQTVSRALRLLERERVMVRYAGLGYYVT